MEGGSRSDERTAGSNALGDAQFRLAMENAIIGMALVASDGTFLAVNPALCTMLGRDQATLKACTWQELTHPEDLAADEALVSEVASGQRDGYRLRKRYVRSDGAIVWGDLSVSCVRDASGEVEYYIAQIVDVTDYVIALGRIEESEARFRLVAENASDLVTLIDRSGVLEWVSPSLTKMLGWPAESVVGTASWDLIHPDDHVAVAAVLDADPDSIHDSPDVELRLLRSDGTYVRFLAAGHFVTDVQMVVSLRFFEEQARAREALLLSEERYRLLAENSSDIVLQTGDDRLISWASQSVRDVLGWQPEDLVGRRFTDFVHPDDVEEGRRQRDESLRTGVQPEVVEARVARADGGWLWMADRGRPILGDDGRLVGGVDALRDIQAEVEAREALRVSEAHYRLLADNATDVVYVFGPDRRVSWISPAVAQTLGWTPEELLGTLMRDLVHEDDRPRVDALRDAVAERREDEVPPGGWTARFRTKDGAYRWLALRATILRDEEGGFVTGVMGLRDVDALVKEREKAQSGEARLQATLDSLLDPHVVLEAVRNDAGRIVDFVCVDANGAARAYMEDFAGELIGLTLTRRLPDGGAEGPLAMFAHAVETGDPVVLDAFAHPLDDAEPKRRFDVRATRIADSLNLTWRDVTERSIAADRIADSERHYRLLADNSSDVVLHSRDGIVLWVSPSLTRTLGWTPDEVVGTDSRRFVHPDDMLTLMSPARLEQASRLERYRLRAKSGQYHWCEVHSSDYIDEHGTADGIVASFRTIDQEIAAERELERRATVDDLTGTLKRDAALRRLAQISANQRVPGPHAAVLFCDVDNLKEVNDEHGHAAGDELLRVLADRFRRTVRSTDTIARVGGDEFIVILEGVGSIAEGKLLAEKLLAAAQCSMAIGGAEISSSVSIGLTLIREGEVPEDVINRADRAMYSAKRAGRNTVRALNQP